MMADGESISAVVDVGDSSVAGDRRLDPLAAVVYLTKPAVPTRRLAPCSP
jgi:hypothetical protein